MTTPATIPKIEPATSYSIDLIFPVEDKDSEGKIKRQTTLILTRPKTRHIKKLALLLGADISNILMEKSENNEDLKKSFLSLFDIQKFDQLTDILAELCGVSKDAIDDIDPIDYPQFMEVISVFFPNLKLQDLGAISNL